MTKIPYFKVLPILTLQPNLLIPSISIYTKNTLPIMGMTMYAIISIKFEFKIHLYFFLFPHLNSNLAFF